MSRQRYPDARNAGRSALVPFIAGEHPSDRHRRRLDANLGIAPDLARWTAERNLTLRIGNQGHHWILERPGFFAEWWPSSAKLVIGRQYDRGIHVHDHAQLMREIGKKL